MQNKIKHLDYKFFFFFPSDHNVSEITYKSLIWKDEPRGQFHNIKCWIGKVESIVKRHGSGKERSSTCKLHAVPD